MRLIHFLRFLKQYCVFCVYADGFKFIELDYFIKIAL
jgi:hypothetical protein